MGRSTWKEEKSPPFRISNNRRGKIEMVKWQGGDFREGMRMMG